MQIFDLAADRWAVFDDGFVFVDEDLTGATYKMQIRQTRDTGAALITLNSVASAVQGVRTIYAGTDTIANHLAGGNLEPEDVEDLLGIINPLSGTNYTLEDNLLLSVVGILIDKANMQTLPFPATRGGDIDLYYDLHVTPVGGLEKNRVGGKFTVVAGATQ